MWVLSTKWNVRPSDLVGIDDAYRAWCFDEACAEFGSSVEEEMEKARKSGGKKSKISAEQREAKADNARRRMLGEEQKFRDIRQLKG